MNHEPNRCEVITSTAHREVKVNAVYNHYSGVTAALLMLERSANRFAVRRVFRGKSGRWFLTFYRLA